MLQWGRAQLLEWWTGDDADAALAWEQQGRVGEEVAELVQAGIGPNQLARMPGLTETQAAAWVRAVAGRDTQDPVSRVVFFRAAGFSETPPANLYRLEELTPEEITAWVAAGFDVPGMVELVGLALDRVTAWRQHAYSPVQTRTLLEADPTLTVAEADAFAAVGIVGGHQVDWVRHGSDPAEAVAFDEVDIQPNEARVWRSVGLAPVDAQPGQHMPDEYKLNGTSMYAGMGMRDIEYEVPDPPYTRGEVAARSLEEQAQRRRK